MSNMKNRRLPSLVKTKVRGRQALALPGGRYAAYNSDEGVEHWVAVRLDDGFVVSYFRGLRSDVRSKLVELERDADTYEYPLGYKQGRGAS